jgi:hypothetical protein
MERDRGQRRARMLVRACGALLGAGALCAGALVLSGGLAARAPQVDLLSQRLPDPITTLDPATRVALTSPAPPPSAGTDGRRVARAAKSGTNRLTHSQRAAQRKLLRQSANRAARVRARAQRAAAKHRP